MCGKNFRCTGTVDKFGKKDRLCVLFSANNTASERQQMQFWIYRRCAFYFWFLVIEMIFSLQQEKFLKEMRDTVKKNGIVGTDTCVHINFIYVSCYKANKFEETVRFISTKHVNT